MIPLIIIAGPTGAGKTQLAVELAQKLKAEIISADSRQIYRRLDIGTAKPGRDELDKVRHHLIDIVDPGDSYSAGHFARVAERTIAKLTRGGTPSIICGGTGFYIDALLRPMIDIPQENELKKKDEIRREIEDFLDSSGKLALHARLAGVDPETANRLHPNDIQRVGRALEIYKLSGKPLSEHIREHQPEEKYSPFWIYLSPGKESHWKMLEKRTDRMFESGWVEEVENLLEAGIEENCPGMQSLGYREISALVEGRLTKQEAREQIILETRKYAKRQRTWFARVPARICLRELPENLKQIEEGCRGFINSHGAGISLP